MQRRFKKDPEADLESYIVFVIENISIGNLTTEQKTRELSVLCLTLLASKFPSKSMTA